MYYATLIDMVGTNAHAPKYERQVFFHKICKRVDASTLADEVCVLCTHFEDSKWVGIVLKQTVNKIHSDRIHAVAIVHGSIGKACWRSTIFEYVCHKIVYG